MFLLLAKCSTLSQVLLYTRYIIPLLMYLGMLWHSENLEKDNLDLQYSLNSGGAGSGSDDHVTKCESREDAEAGNNKPLFC